MERDRLKSTSPERRQSVLVLQPSELTLDGGSATVEVTPALRLARNQRMEPRCFPPDRLGLALTGGAAPLRRLPGGPPSEARPALASPPSGVAGAGVD